MINPHFYNAGDSVPKIELLAQRSWDTDSCIQDCGNKGVRFWPIGRWYALGNKAKSVIFSIKIGNT